MAYNGIELKQDINGPIDVSGSGSVDVNLCEESPLSDGLLFPNRPEFCN